MKKNQALFLNVGIGFVIFIATISVYFLMPERTAVDDWGLGFTLLAEFMIINGFFWLESYQPKTNKVFMRSGLSGILILYFLFTATFSLFARQFNNSIKTFVFIQILIIAATIILIILFITSSRRVNSVERSTLQEMANLKKCEERALALLYNSNARLYEKQINKLYESMRYRDKTFSTSLDDQISEKLANLEDALKSSEKEEILNTIFNEIDSLMMQRKHEISNLERGGF